MLLFKNKIKENIVQKIKVNCLEYVYDNVFKQF
jgi:hypothetical protein